MKEALENFDIISEPNSKFKKIKLLKDAVKEFDIDVLLEQEGGTSVTGAVSGFTGKAGQDADELFAGPFHPDFNNLLKSLEQQLDDVLAKQLYNADSTPILYDDYLDVEWKYEFDEYGIDINPEDFINDSESNWKLMKTKLKYDKNPIKKSFVKSSENNWELIDTGLKYDVNPVLKKDNYVNSSETNWEYIKEKV